MAFLTWEDGISPQILYMSRTTEDMLNRLIRQSTEAATPFLRQLTPVGQHFDFDGTLHPGGQLRNSLYWQVGELGAVLHGAEQGVFVAGGTSPHVIAPRTKQALAFYWPKMGGGIVRRRVQHPGNAANDFRQKGMQAWFDGMSAQETILRVVSEWAQGSEA